ncbi:chorismate mutase [Odoribacter lunatus]|uniref:chorismate mutase n=1 Tax=Odoribacter lunatus TaxID=2941335 RepID=UPI003B970656
MKADEWGIFSGMEKPLLIAGPCSAESERQLFETAKALKQEGVTVLRAGIWKPRTRPNCFEGVGAKGLAWMQRVQQELGMKVATEVANEKHVHEALRAGIDILWIGARTTANPFAVQEITDALKGTDVPVLVKNPVNPDFDLWMGALERLNMAGVKKIGAVHRGFSSYTEIKYRNMPQWQIPIELKRRFKEMLLLCDPSHIAGKREYLREISQQAMDLGFDGLMIESHISPETALSDAAQQLTPVALKELLKGLVIRNVESENSAYRESIEELRNRIDQLDDELVSILADRMKIAEKIGHYKKQNSITILQTERWEEILKNVFEKGEKCGLDNEFLQKIFRAIHQASIDVQTRIMN